MFNLDGEVRLVVDIMGYLLAGQPTDTRAGRVVPLVAPFRAFDTRQAEFDAAPLGPGRAEDWSFDSFVQDVNIDGEPVGDQSGLLGNLTATNLQRQYPWAPVSSFMTAYPTPSGGDGKPPKISNINITEGDTVPNLALLRYGGDARRSVPAAVLQPRRIRRLSARRVRRRARRLTTLRSNRIPERRVSWCLARADSIGASRPRLAPSVTDSGGDRIT